MTAFEREILEYFDQIGLIYSPPSEKKGVYFSIRKSGIISKYCATSQKKRSGLL